MTAVTVAPTTPGGSSMSTGTMSTAWKSKANGNRTHETMPQNGGLFPAPGPGEKGVFEGVFLLKKTLGSVGTRLSTIDFVH